MIESTVSYAGRVVLVGLLLVSSNGSPRQSSEKAKAKKVAQSWMVLLDEERYVASWEALSEEVRGRTPYEEWVADYDLVIRKSLGKLKGRELVYAKIDKPNLNRATINYASAYENWRGAGVLESLTLTRDPKGVWWVRDYSCHPVPKL